MVATAEADRPKASDAKAPKPKTPRSPKKDTAKRSMTDDHKAAIAEGREQARTVGRYLEALEVHKPRRGRKVTQESLQKKLERIETELAEADPLERLNLLQQKKDITQQLETKTPETDIKALEAEFVKVAKTYAERKGIARSTFVEVGVPADVIKAAGI